MHDSSINIGNSDSLELTMDRAAKEILPIISKKTPKEIVQSLEQKEFNHHQILEIILDDCAVTEFIKFFREAGWLLEEILELCKKQNELPDSSNSYKISLDDIAMSLKDEGLSIIEIIQILQKTGFDDLEKIAMALNGIPNYDDYNIYTAKEVKTALEALKTPEQEIQKIMDRVLSSIRDIE